MTTWVTVANCQEFESNPKKTMVFQDRAIAIFYLNQTYYAIEDACSHHRLPLSEGKICDDIITCPFHGAQFCLKTGAALCGPAHGNIVVFQTRIVNQEVQIAIDG